MVAFLREQNVKDCRPIGMLYKLVTQAVHLLTLENSLNRISMHPGLAA